MKLANFILVVISCSLAESRFWNVGIGAKELSDEVMVEINNQEEVRLTLTNGKGSVRLVQSGLDEAIEPHKKRTITSARISRGPAGIKCYFAARRDDEDWVSEVFAAYQTMETPFFAIDLWCYLPVENVVRLMISKEAQAVDLIDVELLDRGEGGMIFGRGKSFTVERAQIVHGSPTTCTLQSRPRRLGASNYLQTGFSSTSPFNGPPVPNVVSVVCRGTLRV